MDFVRRFKQRSGLVLGMLGKSGRKSNGDLGSMQLDDLLAKLKEEVDTKAK